MEDGEEKLNAAGFAAARRSSGRQASKPPAAAAPSKRRKVGEGDDADDHARHVLLRQLLPPRLAQLVRVVQPLHAIIIIIINMNNNLYLHIIKKNRRDVAPPRGAGERVGIIPHGHTKMHSRCGAIRSPL